MTHSLRMPWLIGAAAVLLVLMPVVNIVAVLFGGGDELSYDHGISMTSCGIKGAPCWTIVDLQIGNTGRVSQERIDIDLTSFPEFSAMGHRAVGIVASNAKPAVPRVSIDAEGKRISIENLDANQMMEFELMFVGIEARAALGDAEPVVHASGRVIRSNPKATALARAFRTAFAFLI